MSCASQCGQTISVTVQRVLTWERVTVSYLLYLLEEVLKSVEDGKLRGDLARQLQDRIVELAQKETDTILKEWEHGYVKPAGVKGVRDEWREHLKTAPTAAIRTQLRRCIGQLHVALKQGSRDEAAKLLRDIEKDLELAEEILTGSSEFIEWELGVAERHIRDSRQTLESIENIPHVKYTGWPAVAKERGLAPEALAAHIRQRIKEANELLLEQQLYLEQNREEVLRQQQEAEAKRRVEAKRLIEAAHERDRQQRLEKVIEVMTRRNKLAGQAALQCVEHLRLGNINAAKTSLDAVRRHDFGIPPELQEAYGRALQNRR